MRCDMHGGVPSCIETQLILVANMQRCFPFLSIAVKFWGCMQGAGHDIVCGDVGAAWEQCAHVVEGSVRVGGQEHFYLEPQGTVILPSENDEYVVISSTQVRRHGRLQAAVGLGIVWVREGTPVCILQARWAWQYSGPVCMF